MIKAPMIRLTNGEEVELKGIKIYDSFEMNMVNGKIYFKYLRGTEIDNKKYEYPNDIHWIDDDLVFGTIDEYRNEKFYEVIKFYPIVEELHVKELTGCAIKGEL